MSGWVNEQMEERADGRTSRRKNEQTEERADRRTSRRGHGKPTSILTSRLQPAEESTTIARTTAASAAGPMLSVTDDRKGSAGEWTIERADR